MKDVKQKHFSFNGESSVIEVFRNLVSLLFVFFLAGFRLEGENKMNMPRLKPFFLQLIPTTPFSLELFLFTGKVKRDKKCNDKGFSFSFIVCLAIVTLIFIATFRPHTAALHKVFLIRCVKNRIVPRDLRVRSPVPTKGPRRVA